MLVMMVARRDGEPIRGGGTGELVVGSIAGRFDERQIEEIMI
jgi:hypothetical protein